LRVGVASEGGGRQQSHRPASLTTPGAALGLRPRRAYPPPRSSFMVTCPLPSGNRLKAWVGPNKVLLRMPPPLWSALRRGYKWKCTTPWKAWDRSWNPLRKLQWDFVSAVIPAASFARTRNSWKSPMIFDVAWLSLDTNAKRTSPRVNGQSFSSATTWKVLMPAKPMHHSQARH